MAGLKQIMEIFMTINQPLSSEQRVRWYKQRRGLQMSVHALRFKVAISMKVPHYTSCCLARSQAAISLFCGKGTFYCPYIF